jgi:hypothetical protein
MVKFMAFVGPQLKAQGLYVRATGGKKSGSAAYKTWFQILAPYVNGLENEYFEQAGSDFKLYNIDPTDWHGDWLGWLGLVDVAQNAGIDFYGGMRGDATETGKMMYGKASFLLAWNGKGGGFFWASKVPSVDPWNPAWTTDVGTPTAARYQVGVGWRRNYSAGTVLVNPSASSAQTFDLGASYTTPGGQTVTTVTLQPTTAMILTGSATTPPPPPPPPPPTTFNDTAMGTGTGQFEYVGSWAYQTTSTYAYMGDNHLNSTGGTYYQFRFNGTRIAAYATKGPSMGIGAYSIDGGPETLVDHYYAFRQDQQLLFTSPVLSSGLHTLKVRVTHTKNAAANSYWVNADKVVVTP